MKIFFKWLKRTVLGIGLIVLLSLLFLWIAFNSARQDIIADLPGESQVIETSEGIIEYKIQGNSKKYCLLLHGTPGSYRTFNIYPLLDNGYSVLSVSRPGYFRTPLSTGKTLKEQSQVFTALLDTLQIDSATVIGFSGGVPSAVQFAIDYPQRCKQLIILAGIAEKIDLKPPAGIQKLLLSYEFGTWLLIKLMVMQIDNDEGKQQAETYTKHTMLPFSQTAIGRQNDRELFINYPDFTLEKVKCPTVIIHGTADNRIPFSQAEIFSKRIPGAKLIKMEGKNHFDVVFFEFDESLKEALKLIN